MTKMFPEGLKPKNLSRIWRQKCPQFVPDGKNLRKWLQLSKETQIFFTMTGTFYKWINTSKTFWNDFKKRPQFVLDGENLHKGLQLSKVTQKCSEIIQILFQIIPNWTEQFSILVDTLDQNDKNVSKMQKQKLLKIFPKLFSKVFTLKFVPDGKNVSKINLFSFLFKWGRIFVEMSKKSYKNVIKVVFRR